MRKDFYSDPKYVATEPAGGHVDKSLSSLIVLAIIIWVIGKIVKIVGDLFSAPSEHSLPREPSSSPPFRAFGTSQQTKQSQFDRHDLAGDDCWTPAGTTAKVQEYEIPGGLIYVGVGLRNGHGWSTEPALINPTLPIAPTPIGSPVVLNYWPSYERLQPAERGQHLAWLATGRKDPDINIGFVFIHFYGLERRAINDSIKSVQARNDLPDIRAEVARLLRIYGPRDESFHKYASSFLDYLDAKSGNVVIYDNIAPEQVTGLSELSVRATVGKQSRDGAVLSQVMALAWVYKSDDVYLRTPATRCTNEFITLFIEKYKRQYPKGLLVKPNKTILEYYHQPASNGLHNERVPVLVGDQPVPDVMRLKRPNDLLSNIVRDVEGELDAYSRWLGRNAQDTNRLEALALLPPALLNKYDHPALVKIRKQLDKAIGEQPLGRLNAGDLLASWPNISSDVLSKKEHLIIAQLLSGLGYGMEPDVRFGALRMIRTATVIVYRQPKDAPHAPSAQYTAATMLLKLATLVSAADGAISQEEESFLEWKLEQYFQLSSGERLRLHAHLQYLLSNPLSMAGINKHVADLADEEKNEISSFLISVALADGYADPAEVQVLEKIYKAMGMDLASLYADVHHQSTAAVPSKTAPTTQLDDHLLAKKLRETEQVSALLASVLSEEQDIPPQVVTTSSIEGLDGPHSALFVLIQSKRQWTRVELEAMAAEHGVLLDGALDTLNEWAYEHHDIPLIEEIDEDIYEVELSTI